MASIHQNPVHLAEIMDVSLNGFDQLRFFRSGRFSLSARSRAAGTRLPVGRVSSRRQTLSRDDTHEKPSGSWQHRGFSHKT